MIFRSFFLMLMFINIFLVKPFPSISHVSYTQNITSFEPFFQKGMSYVTYANLTPDAYNSAESDESLRRMRQVGVEWVAISVVGWYQANNESADIHENPNQAPTEEALAHVIQSAHHLSMKVMLKPMIDLEDGRWRGEIQPSYAWFQNYTNYITFFAEFAEQYNVEMFCIGTEYKYTTLWAQQWRDIISRVRSLFHGNLTYAAIWDEFSDISWWSDLDYVGINAYFPLSDKNNPSITDMKATWEKIANYLELLYSKVKKPIIFTEIGYLSTDGTNQDPSNYKLQNNMSRTTDLQEQADCYETTFQAIWRKSWFYGMYWWYWQTHPNATIMMHDSKYNKTLRDYTPQNKPAEGVITHWYSMERRLDTTLTLEISKQNIKVGDSTTLTAILRDENSFPISNADIDFYLNESIETKVGSSITDSFGVTTFTFQLGETGVFQLRARFNGTQNYKASDSNSIVLAVKGIDYTSYIIGGISLLAAVEAIVISVLGRKWKSFSKSVPKA